MANGYLNTYQEEPIRNRSNHLLTDWVHPIAPSSEHSVQSSTSSIKSRPGGLSLEARQRAASADSVPKAKKVRASSSQTEASSQPQSSKGNMSGYTNGDNPPQSIVVPQYHQEYPPSHISYPPPHMSYHHAPQTHQAPTYLPRHADMTPFPGSPASMFGPPLQAHMSNGHHHSAPQDISQGRPSSRKSAKNVASPVMTYTALERKLSTATSATHESSTGRTTPPGPSSQPLPQSQRPSASARKANGSVPKKRGRPPKIKPPTAEDPSSATPASAESHPDSAPRKAKRQRIAPPPPAILTPPPTSIARTTSDEGNTLPTINDDDAENERRRKTLAIMTHQTDGRRLDCNSDYVDRQEYPAARQRGPGLVMDDKGTASFDAGEAISHELAWIEKSLPSPPLTADAASKTPKMDPAPIPDTEINATPQTRAFDLERRMQRFKAQVNRPQAAETKFMEGGRVITPGPGLTDLLMNPYWAAPQQTRPSLDDNLGSIVQPDWPEIPGSVAWPHQDPIREGARRKELASIEKYLASSDSDEEDETPERFRISIRNTAVGGRYRPAVPDRYTLIDGAPSDALTALKLTMRNHTFDGLETSSLACDCGVQYDVQQPVVQCTNCRDIHHAACYPRRELPQTAWETFFCRACRERVMRHATPVQTPRAYAQSDMRSSAFKDNMAHRTEMAGIALMPSPIFPMTTRTPYGQLAGGRARSPRGPVQARTLSYSDDPFFKYFEVPVTPAPASGPRTPRDGGGGFDVMSTPSRHLDYSTLVRYPRPSDSRNRSMMSDTMAFSTPLSSRMPSSAGSSTRPMMMSIKPTSTPLASSSSSLTAGPSNSSATTGPSTGPNTGDIGAGSPPSNHSHHLLGGALIRSPTQRNRLVSKNNLSSLHVDSSGDLMGPMIDAADDEDR